MSLNYFEKMVEPAALNCTLGEHSYKNDNQMTLNFPN